jgi:prephenate dehydrogenase
MTVTIIGLGLIGGSIATDLRAASFASHLIGVDNNADHCKKALELGLVDSVATLDDALKITDLIVIAIPVDNAKALLPNLLDAVNDKQVVVDMGSTKAGICAAVEGHANRARFVASHPIAGTENVGPSAAIPNLFRGKMTIICDRDHSADDALNEVLELYRALAMEIIFMPAEEHDKHIAYVSHLSHISSFTLGLTVLEMEKNERNIFNLAGSGFASTVRLAKSSPDMWAPIFEQNSDNLLAALDTYIAQLTGFRQDIADQNKEGLHERMTDANKIRRILDGIALKSKK